MAGIKRRAGKPDPQQLNPESFWQQAMMLYNNKDVQELCLRMQDEHGLNVNLLLLMMWLEEQKAPLTLAQFEELRDAVNRFNQDFTGPLREQRRRLSQHAQLSEKSRQQLKKHLLAAELTLEAEEQALLVQIYHNLPQDNASPFCWKELVQQG